jgi:small subunit ribosomal protein S6
MRVYEEVFVVRPDATEEEVDMLIAQFSGVITSAGGTVDKADKWGRRNLAYPVEKFKEGIYVVLSFQSAQSDLVKELERRLRVTDAVIKFLTIRLDERLKWVEKRKKKRAERDARKPAPPPPSAAVTEGAPAPGAPAPAAPLPGRPNAPEAAADAAPEAPAEAAPVETTPAE